jgi:peptidoglycan hydrolase CwlO-like protein
MKSFIALGLLAAASVGFSQGAPSDVPKDHWAYHAIDELFKVGLLVGYPDGQFRGTRPVTRYELAASIDSLTRMQETAAKKFDIPTQTPNAELDKLRQNLQSLQAELDALKPKRKDIDALQKSMQSLQTQLEKLKESSKAIRDDLQKPPTKIPTPRPH